MRGIISKLYNNQILPPQTNPLGPAFGLLLGMICIIVILSFYLKKTYLGRNWEVHRCDYIFMSGYLQPNDAIKPSDYTKQNLKYCIKQTIYNDTPLLPHMKDTFDKLKYLIDYVKKQIGLYEYKVQVDVDVKSDKYNKSVTNKINYLRYKQKHLETIYNEISNKQNQTVDKIYTGIDNLDKLNTENEINDKYTTDRYMNHVSQK